MCMLDDTFTYKPEAIIVSLQIFCRPGFNLANPWMRQTKIHAKFLYKFLVAMWESRVFRFESWKKAKRTKWFDAVKKLWK